MMNKLLFAFCVFCLPLYHTVMAQNIKQAKDIRNTLLDPKNKSVLVVAHRGDWRNAPENSLLAIENVIRMGGDIVEIDIQKTKDGHLILMHDETLDRTTTGRGKVSDYTLSEIKQLKLRNGLGIHTRHTVPTLREALTLAKDKIMINLDKAYNFFDEVYPILEETGTIKQIIMKGGKPFQQVKRDLGNYLDKIIYMPVIDLDKGNAMSMIEDFLNELSPVAFEFSYVSDTNPLPQKLGDLLKGKSRIWYNTLWDTMSGGHDDDLAIKNPQREYGYLIDSLNASIIQTDIPGFLIEYLKSRDLFSECIEYLHLESPNKNLRFSLLQKSDKIFYDVTYKGEKIILSSQLGIEREDGNFIYNLKFVSQSDIKTIDEKYELKTGKRLLCHNYANEQTVKLLNNKGQYIEIIIRAYNDGIAFCYKFPEKSDRPCKIIKEITAFQLPIGGKAWIHPYDWNSRLKPSYETYCKSGIQIGTPAPHEQGWAYPMLFNSNSRWIMITEAGLNENYGATHIRSNRDGIYNVCFAEEEETVFQIPPEPIIKSPFVTSWRVIVVGENLSDIVETNIVQNLNPSCALKDVDWIKPGRACWSWWSEPLSTKDYESQLSYIDFAAQMGWEYTLIDAGWHKMPPKQLKNVINYANSKKVGVWLWYHSGAGSLKEKVSIWNLMSNTKARRKELKRISELGVKGIKVDFFDTDKYPIVNLYKDILEDAAKKHIMVSFHGATLPRGLERTYPNLLTIEAVRGAEYLTNQVACDMAPSHNTTLPFTRNPVGSMDYTPVTFSNRIYNHKEAINRTTKVHQLALAVIFESGLQIFADNKMKYEELPSEIREYLSNIPVAWDETKLIDGYPGTFVIMARRKNNFWYIGGINGLNKKKDVTIDLSFLSEGKQALLITDSNEESGFEIKKGKLNEILPVSMLPNGGFVYVVGSGK